MKNILLSVLIAGFVITASAGISDIWGTGRKRHIKKGSAGTIFWLNEKKTEKTKLHHLSMSGPTAGDWIAVYDIELAQTVNPTGAFGEPVFCISTIAGGFSDAGFTKDNPYLLDNCLVIQRLDTDVNINVVWEDVK